MQLLLHVDVSLFDREREKAELKDRKVLEILQSKDDKLDFLQRDLDQATKQVAQALAA